MSTKLQGVARKRLFPKASDLFVPSPGVQKDLPMSGENIHFSKFKQNLTEHREGAIATSYTRASHESDTKEQKLLVRRKGKASAHQDCEVDE